MEHLIDFLASGNALLAAILSIIVAMFIYFTNRFDKLIDILRKQNEEYAKNRTSDKKEMNDKFNEVNTKIDGVQDALNTKIDGLQKDVNGTTQRVARIEGYLELLQRNNINIEGNRQTPPVQGNQQDAADAAAGPSAKTAGQTGAPGKDSHFAYQVPPDRGHQQDAAAGVTEPPPSDSGET